MTVDTNHLIERLGDGLTPVQPLRRPWQRAAAWLAGCVVYFGILAFVVSGLDFTAGGRNTGLLISQLIGVGAGMLAGIAAFASVIPGYSKRVLIWPAFATLIWLAAFLFSAADSASTDQAAGTSPPEWVCVGIILLGGGPLIAALGAMLRRGAPLNPMLTGLLGAMAVGLLANFSACLSLPHSDGQATLIWHGSAIVALAVVGVIGARYVLAWGRVTGRTAPYGL
jgi:hypothetical protein